MVVANFLAIVPVERKQFIPYFDKALLLVRTFPSKKDRWNPLCRLHLFFTNIIFYSQLPYTVATIFLLLKPIFELIYRNILSEHLGNYIFHAIHSWRLADEKFYCKNSPLTKRCPADTFMR